MTHRLRLQIIAVSAGTPSTCATLAGREVMAVKGHTTARACRAFSKLQVPLPRKGAVDVTRVRQLGSIPDEESWHATSAPNVMPKFVSNCNNIGSLDRCSLVASEVGKHVDV